MVMVRKYPRDRPGEEARDNARVWRVYRDRANDSDEDVIGGSHATLDVLLIFAGLFSAVSTSFLLEAQKQLQPDQITYLTSAFLAVHLNQTVAADALDPSAYVAPLAARWVTALWLVSLTISLFVSLLAILAKQWLEEYSSRMRAPAASHKRWALRHAAFNRGLQKWQMDMFIGSLPVALHVSLFIFLAGLALFFWDQNRTMALVILIATSAMFVFYAFTTLAPLVWTVCPTRTPLLQLPGKFLDLIFDMNSPKGLTRAAQAEDTLIAQDEHRYIEQVILWMTTNLPVEEEVDAAIAAMASLGSGEEEKSRSLSKTDTAQLVTMAMAMSKRTATILSNPDTAQPFALRHILQARGRIEELCGRDVSLPPVVALEDMSFESRKHMALVAICLGRGQQQYPASLNMWLNTTDAKRPYPQRALDLLLDIDVVYHDAALPLRERLAVSIRLLCFEVEEQALLSIKDKPDKIVVRLLDFIDEHLENEPTTYGCSNLVEPRLRCLRTLRRLLMVGTSHQTEQISLQTSNLISAYLSLLSAMTDCDDLSPSESAFADCVANVDAYMPANTVWPQLAIENAHALAVAASEGHIIWSWGFGLALRTVLTQLSLLQASEGSDLYIKSRAMAKVIYDSVLESKRARKGCKTETKPFTEFVARRSMAVLLEARDGRPSCWSLLRLMVPTIPSFGRTSFQLSALLVALHRRGVEVEPLARELLGLTQDETPVWNGLPDLYIVRDHYMHDIPTHLHEVVAPATWDVFAKRLAAIDPASAAWKITNTVKEGDNPDACAHKPDTLVVAVASEEPCTVCLKTLIFKDEDRPLLSVAPARVQPLALSDVIAASTAPPLERKGSMSDETEDGVPTENRDMDGNAASEASSVSTRVSKAKR
ncbi:hypothetical protein BKA62DRAFT_636001 [Auriculariales sp. MPI-PUGE-AT-0066]|nr:hypothetical protein BKA62DRAFT_636001 [Auriculariales sp. MPI-PUGE-AT-0066]